MPAGDKLLLDTGELEESPGTPLESASGTTLLYTDTPCNLYLADDGGDPPSDTSVLLLEAAAAGGGRVMSSLANRGGLAGEGGIAGIGGGLAG